MDCAVFEQGIASLANLDFGQGIIENIACFNGATSMFPDEQTAPLATMDLAVAHNWIASRADFYTSQGIICNVAPLYPPLTMLPDQDTFTRLFLQCATLDQGIAL